MNTFTAGQIVEVSFPGRDLVKVGRIVAPIDVGGEIWYRVVWAEDDNGASDKQLVARSKAFAYDPATIRPHDTGCGVCHKSGLVIIG